MNLEVKKLVQIYKKRREMNKSENNEVERIRKGNKRKERKEIIEERKKERMEERYTQSEK